MRRYPKLDKVFKVFGPSSWRYALEHIDRAVQTNAPPLNRLNVMYKTTDADVTLFLKHFSNYYLMVGNGKQFGADVCRSVADIFLGHYGAECTPVKLLCYFANYSRFKGSFRDLDPEDIIVQYANKFQEWWGNQMAKYDKLIQKPQSVDTQPCGIEALRLTVKKWIQDGEDPREHALYKVIHIVTDELIEGVRTEIASGVF